MAPARIATTSFPLTRAYIDPYEGKEVRRRERARELATRLRARRNSSNCRVLACARVYIYSNAVSRVGFRRRRQSCRRRARESVGCERVCIHNECIIGVGVRMRETCGSAKERTGAAIRKPVTSARIIISRRNRHVSPKVRTLARSRRLNIRHVCIRIYVRNVPLKSLRACRTLYSRRVRYLSCILAPGDALASSSPFIYTYIHVTRNSRNAISRARADKYLPPRRAGKVCARIYVRVCRYVHVRDCTLSPLLLLQKCNRFLIYRRRAQRRSTANSRRIRLGGRGWEPLSLSSARALAPHLFLLGW